MLVATKLLMQPVYGLWQMEASSSFKGAIALISCQLRSIFNFTTHPPLIISQDYKTSGSIAHHEGIPHPVGTLFILHREHEMLLSAAVGGESSQEKTLNDETHTVLASYGGHACEQTFSLSTSHSLSPRSCMKLYYASDSRGGSFCSLHTCHNFNEEVLLSSSYAEGLSSDPTFDIEFQQQKQFYKVTGKLQKNLTSGLHFLNLQSRAALPAELTLKNSLSTDLQGNGYFGLEVSRASSGSSCQSRAVLGMDGTREFAVQGSQTFWKSTYATVSASTSFNAQNTLSLKLEHKFSKENEISMNVTSGSRIQEASIMASFADQRSSWKLKYRKAVDDGHLLGLEWRHRGCSDGVCSLIIEAGCQGIVVNGEYRHFF